MPRVLAQFVKATFRCRDQWLLPGTNWKLEEGQHWGVVGHNGAGKTTIVGALRDPDRIVQGCLTWPSGQQGVEVVSFDREWAFLTHEFKQHHIQAAIGGYGDEKATSVREVVERGRGEEILARLGGGGLLDRQMHTLSTGELRKIQLSIVLARHPSILVLDEPFNGLDTKTGQQLIEMLQEISDTTHLVLVVHREEHLVPQLTHVLCLGGDTVLYQGTRDGAVSALEEFRLGPVESYTGTTDTDIEVIQEQEERVRERDERPEVIGIEAATVQFGESRILSNVSWDVRAGERWVVRGGNGAGKSTLMTLITGDHPQAFSNDLRVFGLPRGLGGISLWDIRRRVGIMSVALHSAYNVKDITVLRVVCSGFKGTIGLFTRCTEAEETEALDLIQQIGIDSLKGRVFLQLSHGQQRMVLLCRALVGSTKEIIILDEPLDGLDGERRNRVLDVVDRAVIRSGSALAFVTHHFTPDDVPSCVTRELQLEGGHVVYSGDVRLSRCRDGAVAA